MTLRPPPDHTTPAGELAQGDLALSLLDLKPGVATLVLDHELRVLLARGEAVATLGRSVSEIEGKLLQDVLSADRLAAIEPRFRQTLTGRPQRFTVPPADAEDEPWNVETRILQGRDAIAVQIRRRIPSGSEQRLRAVMEALSEGIVVQDNAGIAVDCNPAALAILGLSRDDLIGRGPMDSLWRTIREDGAPYPPEQHPAIVTLRSGVELDGVVMGVQKRDGTQTWIAVTTRLLHLPGEPVAVVNSLVDITERRRLLARLRAAADRDPLTELVNRRRFGEDLATQLARCRRLGELAAIVLLDLDRFKSVNDSLGHQAGDALLVAVANAMLTRLRGSDVLARLGGDEFAVLLPATGREEGERVAFDLVEIVRETADVHAPGLGVSASAGVAIVDPEDGVPSPDEALAAADRALYAAKGPGGGSRRR